MARKKTSENVTINVDKLVSMQRISTTSVALYVGLIGHAGSSGIIVCSVPWLAEEFQVTKDKVEQDLQVLINKGVAKVYSLDSVKIIILEYSPYFKESIKKMEAKELPVQMFGITDGAAYINF